MDFDEVVDHFRALRVGHQQFPLPVPYPPQLLCFDAETLVCQVASKRGTSQAIAAMLSAIPVCNADRAVLSIESLVRSIEDSHGLPMAEDPNARAALLTVDCQRGPLNPDVAIDAFSVNDAGELSWLPGEWYSPLLGRLIGAIDECLVADVPDAVVDFVTWMQINGYAIKVHESLYPKHED